MTKATPTTRRCTRCKVEKPLDAFAGDRSRPLGKMYICRVCDGQRHAQKWHLQFWTPERLAERERHIAEVDARLRALGVEPPPRLAAA